MSETNYIDKEYLFEDCGRASIEQIVDDDGDEMFVFTVEKPYAKMSVLLDQDDIFDLYALLGQVCQEI